MKLHTSAAMAILALTCAAARAQALSTDERVSGSQIQRLQQRQIDAAQTHAVPDVLKPSGREIAVDLASLPNDDPCFRIERLAFDDRPSGWLASLLQPVIGQCVGKNALKRIQGTANEALIARGYVTSRVLIPPQSLSSGTLTLHVVPGRIHALHTQGIAPGWMRFALPTSSGAWLNQRDIDQGLENIRRLPSQNDAHFDITPGEQVGESDLIFHPGTGKRWHASISVDNGGQDSTGKYPLNGTLTLDSPLHLYDQLQFSGSTNANFGQRDKGNTSIAVSYSIPLGYAIWSFDASRSHYLQTLAGFDEPIEYGGVQSRIGTGVSAVVFRNAHLRTELSAKLFHQQNRNTIDGVDVAVQGRDLYGYELGLAHHQYLGNAQIDASLGWRASLPGITRNPGTVIGDDGFTGTTQVETASFDLMAPFRMFGQPFAYRFGWNMQNARTPLTSPDYFSIGSRYAVRGFDQQWQLAAESGWVVSHELSWYLPTPLGTQSVYAGLDLGRVRGPAAQWLLGDTLAGAVIGVRGAIAPPHAFGSTISYDLSLGTPVAKPKGFPDQSPTLLFQLTSLF